MTKPQILKEQAAIDAFLNAALREGVLEASRIENGCLLFRDQHGCDVSIGIRAQSSLRFLFEKSAKRHNANGWENLSAYNLLSDLSEQSGPTFQTRVLDSLSAIQAAPERQGTADLWNFIEAEQALKSGHPFHPNPRSRDEMSDADAKQYAPEQEQRFPIRWLAAKPEVLIAGPSVEAQFRELATSDFGETDAEYVPIPWHPWQAKLLLQNPVIGSLIDTRALLDLGEGRGTWAATSSMRCIHAWHAPFMIKTSLSLRLTNSVRHLSMREVMRGIHISNLLQSDLGKQIQSEFPTLRILREPGYAALLDPTTGIALDETVVVLRDNPFQDARSPGPVLLAALCEASATGMSPLGQLICTLGPNAAQRWFERFLDVAIWPLLELRARYGLLFGAHQQNLMVALSEGWPDVAWVRDCQGTGHIDSFHDLLTTACPGIGEGSENVVTAELGDGLVIYYVVVNSVLNTLSTLVLDGLAEETALLEVWRAFLIRARAKTPGDDTLYTRLLNRPTLTCKGNFSTSSSGINEADGDARGQLATFFDLPNPILETIYA